ncbi:MAG TPA: hypothetical protein P5136_03780 [Methanofastidiosum sp.]|nr:hypothetical protein [Methanofastidiosum sp.]
MSNKKYGFEGTVNPTSISKGFSEHWEKNNIVYSIENTVFKVEFDNEEQEDEARKTANLFISSWNLNNNTHLIVDFNHSWRPGENNRKNSSLKLSESLTLRDTTKTIHKASSERGLYVVGEFKSDSFIENSLLVEKALKDEALGQAIEFYSEEVTDSKRPLYGIYKAVESLTNHLGKEYPKKGRKVLGELAGKNKKFVDEIMQSTEFQRHSDPKAEKKLSDEECKSRTKILIQAYADSL